MDITEIILAVLGLVAVLWSVLACPFVKSKLSEVKRKRIKEIVDTAVRAAEKLFPSFDGEKYGKEKLQYVADCLKKQGIVFNVNDIYDEIRTMIEGAVEELCS